MDERTRRIGLNEAVFREVNERLADLEESFPKPGRKLDLICECGDASCASRLEMDHEEYERLRADPATFATVTWRRSSSDVKRTTSCVRLPVARRNSPKRRTRAASQASSSAAATARQTST